MGFQILAVDPAVALGAVDQSDIVLVVADSDRGYPCRATLEDARKGERLYLIPYAHQPAGTHRSSGPIYLREGAQPVRLQPNHVPEMLSSRLLSLRAYGLDHGLRDADVVDGLEVGSAIESILRDPEISYLHVHNAKPGCFACRVERA